MKRYISIKLIVIFVINLVTISHAVYTQTLSGRVYEGTTGTEPPTSKPMLNVTVKLYGSNDANDIGTFVISTTTTDSAGWYGLPVSGAFDFYNIVEENPTGYDSDGATSVSGTVKTADWIQYTYDQLSQTTTGNKFWDRRTGQQNNPPVADADGPYTGTVNQPVQFDGSGSYDPDAGDSITSYEWDMDNDGQFDDATGVSPTWTWNSPTTQTIHLMVTDSHGAYGTDSTYVTIEAQLEYDYGDAPDPSYPTLKASNGARHQIDPDVFLGNQIDAEEDGQQSSDAKGDDNGNIDDEDGIVFKSAFIPGNWTPFEATVSVDGQLGVWVDFNGNGSWTDPGESLFQNDTSVFKGVNNWSIFVPANAKIGKTFARFRFSTIPGQTFDGSWQDGEVEDYQIEIVESGEGASVGDWVWHDLDQDGLQDPGEPGLDSVQVSLYDQNGNLLASTLTTFTGFYMFSNITPGNYFINFSLRTGFVLSPPDQGTDDTIDSDAQTSTGDTPLFTLAAGEQYIDVDAGMFQSEGSGEILGNKWHDLNSNGLRDAGEPGIANWEIILDYNQDRVLDPAAGSGDWITVTDSNGDYKFTGYFNGDYFIGEIQQSGWQQTFPDSAFASHLGNIAPYDHWFYVEPNQAISGLDFGNIKEGEDEYDFGDAPDPSFPTLLTSNGARHLITPNLYLGTGIDSEPDGQPAGMADGDDKNIMFPGLPFPSGDEDGVQIPPIITHGSTVQVNVIVSAQGVLNAWLDFNGNGSWADAGEHIVPAMPVVAGINTFSFTVPTGAVIGQSYARFRLSSVRNISFDGLASDGEVEDYAVAIQREGDGGNITIIKDADPKDDTPFWISVVYGVMGGAAPYRDPSMNTSSINNGPAGIYAMGESVPVGWKLTDIVITGDMDNGSSSDLSNGTVDVDLDAGENITVTFKNEKTSGKQFDFGDAPDGTNHHGVGMEAYAGIPARFPTVFDPATGLPSGPIHKNPLGDAWLGNSFSLEEDADIMPDDDGLTNIDPPGNIADRDGRDDGVIFPVVLPSGQNTYFTYSLIIPPGSASLNRYVNVWLDWNRDGDWEDIFTVNNPNDAPEWAVQNELIPGSFPAGHYMFATPMFRVYQPANAQNKPIWMRISIAEQPAPQPTDGRGPASGYEFGETEDYYFFADDTTTGKLYDFGDAPDDPQNLGYPTLHANSGAYHSVVDGFHLGALIDSEPNGQPDPLALGDDHTGMADEDGLVVNPPLIRGTTTTWEITVSATGIFNAWVDFNGNQNWQDANEHIFKDLTLNAGHHLLNFTVPTNSVIGRSFARLRFSNVTGVMSTGYGRDGEVEDYEISIEPGGDGPPIKWRQIPLVNEDPDMPYTPYFFGWDVRSTYDGTYVADDWFCKSPRPVTEIHWWGSYTEWDSAFPPPVAPHAFHIGIWTDVPKGEDTDWSHPGKMIWESVVAREKTQERIVGRDFHPEYMSKPDSCFQYEFIIPPDQWFYQEGDSTIYWLSIAALYDEEPDSFVWGWKTREHYFHDDAVYVYEPVKPTVGVEATKTEPIDEGWDLAFMLKTDEYFLEFDFGDAPAERYQTFLGQNGAHHLIDPRVYLGDKIDNDPDGQPDELALGDDNDGSDDDDGILLKTTLQPGQVAQIEVMASTSGFLNAWIDFNNNGSWNDSDEQVFFGTPLVAGVNLLEFILPTEAFEGKAYARFRFSAEQYLPFFGLAINGEVEDYLIDIVSVGVEQQESSMIPREFRLYQNYPNPFNPATIIRFDLPANDKSTYHVSLSIYNIRGQLVRKLVDEEKSPGAYSVRWNGFDHFGQKVNSGIYLVKMIAGDYKGYQKMIILK